MGLSLNTLKFIETSIEDVFGTKSNLRMLELGDQCTNDIAIPEKTGKSYFENRGFKHVSVDLNGFNGTLARDLTKPEQFEDWHGEWDIITNAGTTEHVEPFESQYDCFNIIHDCIKVGGIAIHLNPDAYELDMHGTWKNHCNYYYSEPFFEMLANECGYELCSSKVINGLRCVVVKKIKNLPFMKDRKKLLKYIAQRKITLYYRIRYFIGDFLRRKKFIRIKRENGYNFIKNRRW
tara:strand:- start:2074 stop:2778 length:705 start_codon:yes stop_codon:yes gene_type:complete